MIDWVVQFGEGISVLFCHDEELETVSEAWIFWVFLSQWRHSNWVTVNESWLNQCFFNEFFEEGVDDVTNFSVVLFNWNILFSSDSFGFIQSHVLPEVNASDFLDSVNHVDAFEWFVDLDFSSLVVDRSITFNRFSSVLDDTFSQVHDIVEVSVSLVNFNRCELRVVSGIHTFVTEDTSDFVNTFHTTNNETFEVELSRDTKYHVDVLCIVVSDERFSSSTTSFIVKNRCFYFKETLSIEVTTDFRNDF